MYQCMVQYTVSFENLMYGNCDVENYVKLYNCLVII